MASKEVPSSQPLPPSEKEDSFWDDPKFGGPQTQTAVAECSNGFIRRSPNFPIYSCLPVYWRPLILVRLAWSQVFFK